MTTSTHAPRPALWRPGPPTHPAGRAPRRWALLALLWLPVAGSDAGPDSLEIRIGVLSHRGDAITERMWTPTADYLTAALPRHRFRVVPLDFAQVDPAVRDARVDFVLVNPGIYVNLEVRHRVSRIATMRNRVGLVRSNVFGGVIFTRADHPGLTRIDDLRGRSLLAVDRDSLGGFQMAWGELLEQGVDPDRDLARLDFAGTHDAVVLAVGRGDYDAGTVRTDILEQMDDEGAIRLSDYRILNPQEDPEFPFLRSTPLFPEWPFSKLRHTNTVLAQRVAIALLEMPVDHAATRSGGYAGWTIPLDYQPVHDLLRRLHLPPYDHPPAFTLREAIARYWLALLAGGLSLVLMVLLTALVTRLNKRLARAKARLEQQQELILNSVAEGIYGVDLAGRTTFVNRPLVEMTGWKAQDLIGANQHEILHHTHGDGRAHLADECPVYATFRDNQPRFVEDDVFWRKDGTPFPVEYSSTPIRDESGTTVGSVVVFRDVTERKEAEERVRQHQADLAHVARLSTLGEMASGIAHELNQPLTAIATNARACMHLLEDGPSAAEQCSDVMERIAAQAERAGQVIRQIRRFVRKEPPDIRPTPLRGIFETVLGLLRPEARRSAVSLVVEGPEEPLWVLAQEIQIEQVLLNLTRNAVEAMADTPGPRRLTLRTRPLSDARVELAVIDTGPGLPPEIRERLFQPFVTTKSQGLGLGLSISAGILETHGSELLVDSEPGAGACFRFNLPLVPPHEPNDR
ncbi:MAG: PhnD/SsuA/transferrin family substrate-binding protein [Bdellovibrio bacteriovorus]